MCVCVCICICVYDLFWFILICEMVRWSNQRLRNYRLQLTERIAEREPQRKRRTHPPIHPPTKGITPKRNQSRHMVHASPLLKFSRAPELSHTEIAALTHHWLLWCSRKVILLQYQEKILMIRQQCDQIKLLVNKPQYLTFVHKI